MHLRILQDLGVELYPHEKLAYTRLVLEPAERANQKTLKNNVIGAYTRLRRTIDVRVPVEWQTTASVKRVELRHHRMSREWSNKDVVIRGANTTRSRTHKTRADAILVTFQSNGDRSTVLEFCPRPNSAFSWPMSDGSRASLRSFLGDRARELDTGNAHLTAAFPDLNRHLLQVLARSCDTVLLRRTTVWGTAYTDAYVLGLDIGASTLWVWAEHMAIPMMCFQSIGKKEKEEIASLQSTLTYRSPVTGAFHVTFSMSVSGSNYETATAVRRFIPRRVKHVTALLSLITSMLV